MSFDLTQAEMSAIIDESSRTVTREHSDVALRCTEGAVPPEINGVLYRNGPGRLERNGHRYGHLFDGDGHLVRLAFDAGQVRYTNRFVRTRGLVAEEAAGRLLYRGLGTNRPGGLLANALRMSIKNIANTHVIPYARGLLALWEGGLPYRIDPATLETEGPEDFEGRLLDRHSWLSRKREKVLPFAAHPQLDPETGILHDFGLQLGRPPRLLLYRLRPDGTLDAPEAHVLDRMSFIHSFLLTRRYWVFLLPHVDFDILRPVLGRATWAESLRIATERPMEALLIPRDGGPVRRFDTIPGFVFHVVQGHDRNDGALVLDLIHYRDYPPLERFEILLADDNPYPLPHPVRLTLDPSTGACQRQLLSPCPAELPQIAPGGFGQPRRSIYSLGAAPERKVYFLSCVQRVDTETGAVIHHEFCPDLPGEPVLVPDGDGEEGWLLTLVYRAEARRTDLVILRSEDLALQAVLPLPQSLPFGFHGSWVPADSGTANAHTV